MGLLILSLGLMGCNASVKADSLYERLIALEQHNGWRILLCDVGQHIYLEVPSHPKKRRDREPLVSPELNPSLSAAEIKKAERMLEQLTPPPGTITTDVYSNVYLYSVRNRQAVPIFGIGETYESVGDATFSPDGQRIALWVQTAEDAKAHRSQLVLLDGQGRFQEKLLDVSSAGNIAWSSDGKKLAFIANYQQMKDRFISNTKVHPSQGALVVFDLPTRTQRTLIETGVGGGGGLTTYAWSPDDRELVYEGIDDDILVYNFDTRQSRTLIAKGLAEGFPTWSPSGEWITYMDADRSYYRIHPDGSGQELLLEHFKASWWDTLSWNLGRHPVAFMWGPSVWSPDSRYLLYGRASGPTGSQTMLYVVDLNSRRHVRLGEFNGNSPLGSWVEQARGIKK